MVTGLIRDCFPFPLQAGDRGPQKAKGWGGTVPVVETL